MKKIIILAVSLATGVVAFAQDTGLVISSTPAMQQIAVPRQVCADERVTVRQDRLGVGKPIVAGPVGVRGRAAGHGDRRGAATLIGMVDGSNRGHPQEGWSPASIKSARYCSIQTFYETRPMFYDVVFMYGGQRYAMQTPTDPGPTIALTITYAVAPYPSRVATFRSWDTPKRPTLPAYNGQPHARHTGSEQGVVFLDGAYVDRQMR